jgi:nicotinamide mononucleotide transporter
MATWACRWYSSWCRCGAGTAGCAAAPDNSRSTSAGWFGSALGWAAGFALLATFLRYYTDTDVPHVDGFLTAGSLLGQLLLSRKKVENWHVWIAVDILYVGLYLYKGLVLTAILYAVFVAMAAVGLRAWSRAAQKAAP